MRKIKEERRVIGALACVRQSGQAFLMRYHLSRDMRDMRERAMWLDGGRGFPEAEGAGAKALRQECAGCFPGTAKRPAWLEDNVQAESCRKWFREKYKEHCRALYAMEWIRTSLWTKWETIEIFSVQAQWEKRGRVRRQF